jgi:hypothetical protein
VSFFRVCLIPDPRIAGLAGKSLRAPAPAALEDEHAHPGLGETTTGDRAAEAAADHDRVVLGAHTAGAGGL